MKLLELININTLVECLWKLGVICCGLRSFYTLIKRLDNNSSIPLMLTYVICFCYVFLMSSGNCFNVRIAVGEPV